MSEWPTGSDPETVPLIACPLPHVCDGLSVAFSKSHMAGIARSLRADRGVFDNQVPNWRPQANRTLETMASQAHAVLPAWAVRLIAELDAADETAKELPTGLTTEQLNWQPRPNGWSVGQCLDHLCRTNEVYLPAISSSLLGKPSSAVSEITPGWFGRWFISG
jgi:hypothetical protein